MQIEEQPWNTGLADPRTWQLSGAGLASLHLLVGGGILLTTLSGYFSTSGFF